MKLNFFGTVCCFFLILLSFSCLKSGSLFLNQWFIQQCSQSVQSLHKARPPMVILDGRFLVRWNLACYQVNSNSNSDNKSSLCSVLYSLQVHSQRKSNPDFQYKLIYLPTPLWFTLDGKKKFWILGCLQGSQSEGRGHRALITVDVPSEIPTAYGVKESGHKHQERSTHRWHLEIWSNSLQNPPSASERVLRHPPWTMSKRSTQQPRWKAVRGRTFKKPEWLLWEVEES